MFLRSFLRNNPLCNHHLALPDSLQCSLSRVLPLNRQEYLPDSRLCSRWLAPRRNRVRCLPASLRGSLRVSRRINLRINPHIGPPLSHRIGHLKRRPVCRQCSPVCNPRHTRAINRLGFLQCSPVDNPPFSRLRSQVRFLLCSRRTTRRCSPRIGLHSSHLPCPAASPLGSRVSSLQDSLPVSLRSAPPCSRQVVRLANLVWLLRGSRRSNRRSAQQDFRLCSRRVSHPDSPVLCLPTSPRRCPRCSHPTSPR